MTTFNNLEKKDTSTIFSFLAGASLVAFCALAFISLVYNVMYPLIMNSISSISILGSFISVLSVIFSILAAVSIFVKSYSRFSPTLIAASSTLIFYSFISYVIDPTRVANTLPLDEYRSMVILIINIEYIVALLLTIIFAVLIGVFSVKKPEKTRTQVTLILAIILIVLAFFTTPITISRILSNIRIFANLGAFDLYTILDIIKLIVMPIVRSVANMFLAAAPLFLFLGTRSYKLPANNQTFGGYNT